MPKVFVLNKGTHDYSAAEQFGSIVYCTDGNISKYNTAQMVRECAEAMEDSTPDDYILLTSLSTLCSLACAWFAHRHGRVNLLIFKNNKYIERTVVFDN